MIKLSIVIAAFNEKLNVKPLLNNIFKAIRDVSYEIIYVDDGSTDNTAKEVKSFDDKRIKLIELKKNYGQSSALAAGIEDAKGEFIVLMDGDLQNDPSDIPMMLQKIENENLDLVTGIRVDRKDNMLMRKIPSNIANFIIRSFTGVKVKDFGCTLKIFKNSVAKNIMLYGELHRFIPVLAHIQGATISQIKVKHHARKYGKSKYGINRTFKVISDLLLILFFERYMKKPMHLFGTLGLIILLTGITIDFYLLFMKIAGNDIWGKPLLILGVMLTLGGIQIITIGIVAELIIRINLKSNDKKSYKIKNIYVGKN